MAFDAEFDSNIENMYKRAVLDNMAQVGVNQTATAVNRDNEANAIHNRRVQEYRGDSSTLGLDPMGAEALGKEIEQDIFAAGHHYFGGIANNQFAQERQLAETNQAQQLGYYDNLAQDNSLRYQTDKEMEAITAAFNQRRAAEAAARASSGRGGRGGGSDDGDGFSGLFGDGASGDLQFTHDYKTAGRDILGWDQRDAITYGTDANAMRIVGMAKDLYAQGASWAETVANVDSWLQSGNIPSSQRQKYIAMFQAMYGPSWGQQLEPVGQSSASNRSWALDYSNLTPTQQHYSNAATDRPFTNPTKPKKQRTTGVLYNLADRKRRGK